MFKSQISSLKVRLQNASASASSDLERVRKEAEEENKLTPKIIAFVLHPMVFTSFFLQISSLKVRLQNASVSASSGLEKKNTHSIKHSN